METLLILLLCAICFPIYQSNSLNLIEVPREYIRKIDIRSQLYGRYKIKPFKPLRSMEQIRARRTGVDLSGINKVKDNTLKEKIGFLIDQTINDARKDVASIEEHKANYNQTAGYRIGFLMYMVKRSRDVMNELFTVAVNHKSDWKALDQLKIFELIVHTNVDTSNLLRQLLEIATKEQQNRPKEEGLEGQEGLRRLKVVLL